ncbi:MAG: porin [Ignavibacteria bacterium]|jgi:hypothetical protein
MNPLSYFKKLSLIFILSGLNIFIFSQKVTFEGYGATGFKFYDRDILNGYNQETFYEGKLQAEIKYNDEIEAQLDFRGNSTGSSAEFREFSVKFEYFENFTLKIGNIKRPFGYEYLINREAMHTSERNNLYNSIEELGYGGRSVSIMGYYKYSKKRPDFPYTYYVSIFKNNNLTQGISTRFVYHAGNLGYGISYMFQDSGGDEPITANGFEADITFEKDKFLTNIEAFYFQDKEEGIRQRLIGGDENVYGMGAKLMTKLRFDVDGKIIKAIDPVLLFSYYLPDTDVTGTNQIQSLVGANFYLDKKVRVSVNADLRLTKNQYNSEYSTKESRGIIEFLVRF